MKKHFSSYVYIAALLTLILMSGCGLTHEPLPALPDGCSTPGSVVSGNLPEKSAGYSYTYHAYLPPCFSNDDGLRYPVIYLVPGRSGFSSAWFSAGLADVLDELILSGEVPPLIIISTENIESDPLAETIYVELMPFVENQFPVKAERRYRAVAGGSLGGVAAYRLLLQHPEAFSSAGMFGAGLISGEETRVEGWLSSISDDEKIRVFMDTGDEDPLMLDRARVMQATLDEFGVENLLHAGLGGHNYGYWVGNFELYLKWLIQEW